MTISRWLQKQLKKTDGWRELNNRLAGLEKSVKDLNKREVRPEYTGDPTIIEYLNVEKIVVDHYEQSNNFGALGIKSLEGRLNIGANYGNSEELPNEKQKEFEEKLKKATHLYKNKEQKTKPEQTETPPKTTIRSRPGSVQ